MTQKKTDRAAKRIREKNEEHFKMDAKAPTQLRTPLETEKILREVEESRIKLETQNEELRCQSELLRESAEMLALQQIAVFDAAPVGIIQVSNRMMLSANRKFCEMTGYSLDEIVGANTRILYPSDEEYDEFARSTAYQLLFEGRITHSEIVLRRKDGSHITLSATGGSVDKAGASSAHIWVFDDLTERLQAADELQRINENYRLLLQNTDQGIYGIDETGRFTFLNRAALEMFGYRSDELVGRKSHSIIHHSYIDGTPYPFENCPIYRANAAATHSSGDNELFRRRDGTSFPIQFSTYPVPLSDTRTGTVVTFSDITKRKKAESEMSRLARAVKQSPISIMITDASGIIQFVNPRYAAVTGYTVEETIGQKASMLKSGLTPPETYQQLWEAITAGKTWEGEFENKRKDGGIFYEQATISPIRNDHGIITHYLAHKIDITEKKNIMQQLLHSQKLESIGQLSGGLAHDLNNILTVVNGYATLAQQMVDKNEIQENYINEIVKASSRASSLTHSLLAFSRKQEMNRQKQNLNLLITTVASFISRVMRDNIEFTLSLHEEPLGVYVDDVQLEQVLLNLATNARDAMPYGGSLSMATAVGEMDEEYIDIHGFGRVGRYAVITVTDSGHGMDAVTKQMVFDPFFTTKEVGKGTGLGLSMALAIIKQHGGFIELQSESGKGCVFKLYLPLLADALVKAPDDLQDSLVESGTGTILLAEDDPATLSIMQQLLERSGYKVITAVDGKDAVKKFVMFCDEIQLVISDLIMPKKSGRQAFNEIRELSSEVRFIFMSGHPSYVIEREGEFGEDVEIIMKPVLPFDLLNKIGTIIGGNQ